MEMITVRCRLNLSMVQRDLSGKKERKREICVDIVKYKTCSDGFHTYLKSSETPPNFPFFLNFYLPYFYILNFLLSAKLYFYQFITYLTLQMHTQRHYKISLFCSLPNAYHNVWQIENTQSTFMERISKLKQWQT